MFHLNKNQLKCFFSERKMRERRDAKKKQQQEAVENKLRRVQLRESSHALKSKSVYLMMDFSKNEDKNPG